jgi:Protein of unknown function (DUF3176)
VGAVYRGAKTLVDGLEGVYIPLTVLPWLIAWVMNGTPLLVQAAFKTSIYQSPLLPTVMYDAIRGNDAARWLRSLRDSTPSTLHTPTATTPPPGYCENNSTPSLGDFAISPKGSSESHSSRTSKLRKRARAEENNAADSWWWYWEIGACLLSMLFTGLLVIFLVKIDLKPRSLWRLGVEPNTVVAIFATLIKTSMMVSVVSCISQLKWHHFKTKDRPLHHLDIIDDCSRGPWGALILLLRNPRANPIISAFAVITIIGLGIEPSAQQLLETRHRVVALRNASAEIDMASSWSSRGLRTHNSRCCG